MSALTRIALNSLRKNVIIRQRNMLIYRMIKTSTKKEDTAAATVSGSLAPVTKEDFANPNPKNWISFGFDSKDKEHDYLVTHLGMFTGVTLCVVWGIFIWCYTPDSRLHDWAQREAYLELRRREAAGLDLVSPNYIDPANIILPTDEELGDTDIII